MVKSEEVLIIYTPAAILVISSYAEMGRLLQYIVGTHRFCKNAYRQHILLIRRKSYIKRVVGGFR